MSAIIRSVLAPILKLWLRSQVQAAQTIELKIGGADGEILKGQITQAQVSGRGIVYEGLHLSQLSLKAEDIFLNIPQILKGQSLKLLEPLAVQMDLTLTAEDFQLCLKSSVLQDLLDYQLPPMSSDREIRVLLGILLKLLGDQFVLKELQVNNGSPRCQGSFKIAPTDAT
jgi:hypothetical protein